MKEADRSVMPALHEIGKITLPAIKKLTLDNGVPVWVIDAGTQEVIKIEFIYPAGRFHEPQRAVSATVAKMLMEGTAKKSAQQIAEEIEFHGASFSTDAAVDYAQVVLFTLTKHLSRLLPLVYEVIHDASFPAHELATFVQNSKQRLQVNLQKVDFLAHKEFNERLYGLQHPNGYTTSAADYDHLTTEVLQRFHAAAYRPGDCRIIMSGQVKEETILLVNQYFGRRPIQHINGKASHYPLPRRAQKKFFVEKTDAVQAGIRIGKFAVNKQHPDFPKLRVLNTILGGYFGSRLMQNLREDKGFCYGVHSGIASYLTSAHLFITTEVGKEVAGQALKEIYHEVDRLRNEPVPGEELQLVKNYLMGVILADADGPFNVSEIVRGLVVYDQDEEHFYQSLDKIRKVTPEELMQLAGEHLDVLEMTEVVAA